MKKYNIINHAFVKDCLALEKWGFLDISSFIYICFFFCVFKQKKEGEVVREPFCRGTIF